MHANGEYSGNWLSGGGYQIRPVIRCRTALEWRRVAARIENRAVLRSRPLARQRTRVAWPNRSLRAHRKIRVLVWIAERVHWILALLDLLDVVFQHLAI